MNFKTKHTGSYGGNPSKIIELTIEGGGSTITKDVTDLRGYVDENLIMSLRNLADELEEQNQKVGPVKDYRVKGRFTPKIIPFTVEDSEHFRGKWVRTKHMPLRFIIRWYDDVSVCGYSYEVALKELEFEDGRPFGKNVIPTTITK